MRGIFISDDDSDRLGVSSPTTGQHNHLLLILSRLGRRRSKDKDMLTAALAGKGTSTSGDRIERWAGRR
eukprot:CAMPEP_0178566736 /NCGR_PEP_ID=MMETSP0697-20121206/14920_1 /TAXON_ID=265572 /ORGANISM="Extubocellulus spinifer, Strain CCMP396" /LENGTH=68 /DNA_ID=CAMNT_0020200561 /DNA_START=193 /DNA_END=396 /DNA_ORIENTATION=+